MRNFQNKKSFSCFSIIELLVVTLVILLLISLTVPMFIKLKMHSRAAICKGQLRQMSLLLNSYISDNSGYLPNDTASTYIKWGVKFVGDIAEPSTGNNELYSFWSGHLLPYLEVNLPDKYTRKAAVTKVGTTRFAATQWGGPPNNSPVDPLKNGWIVVDDAYRKGGYQDLKSFICPEIHTNTFDVAASIAHNGVHIPRISQLCNGGVASNGAFRDIAGYDYGLYGGVPTTYLANSLYFDLNQYWIKLNTNSYRVDQINDISQKIFLVEGGIADPFGTGSNGAISPPYYSTNNYYVDTDGALMARFYKTTPSVHKLSFVHDNEEEFWIRNDLGYFWFGKSEDLKTDIANKFNLQFTGKAMMVKGGSSGVYGCIYSIVSFVYPDNGKIFESFFKKETVVGSPIGSWEQFVDTPNDYHYLVGQMNVLFGDGSVQSKDNSWLCNTRQRNADSVD